MYWPCERAHKWLKFQITCSHSLNYCFCVRYKGYTCMTSHRNHKEFQMTGSFKKYLPLSWILALPVQKFSFSLLSKRASFEFLLIKNSMSACSSILFPFWLFWLLQLLCDLTPDSGRERRWASEVEGRQSKVLCSSTVLLTLGIAMGELRCCICFAGTHSFGKFVVGFIKGSFVFFKLVSFPLAESVKDEDLEVVKEVYLPFWSLGFCVCSLDIYVTLGKAINSSFNGLTPALRQEGWVSGKLRLHVLKHNTKYLEKYVSNKPQHQLFKPSHV